jgi:hypothetical protein
MKNSGFGSGGITMFKRILLGSCFFFLINSALAQTNAQNSFNDINPKFCVQTFNAYGPLYGMNLELRTDFLLQVIKKQGACSFFNLQEVWFDSHYEQLALTLAANQDFFGIYANDLSSQGKTLGLASFIEGKEMSSGIHIYQNNKDGFLDWFRQMSGVGKAVAWAKVKTPFSDSPFIIANTHLHPTSETMRIAQILELIQELLEAQEPDAPMIISGDFNSEPNSLEIKLLHDVLGMRDSYLGVHKAYAEDDCTYCAENTLSWDGSNRVIDFILYRSSLKEQLIPTSSNVNIKSHYGQYLSDHFGLRSYFSLMAAPQVLGPPDSFGERLKTARATLDEAEEILLSSQDSSDFANLIVFIAELRKRMETPDLNDPWIWPFLVTDSE